MHRMNDPTTLEFRKTKPPGRTAQPITPMRKPVVSASSYFQAFGSAIMMYDEAATCNPEHAEKIACQYAHESVQ